MKSKKITLLGALVLCVPESEPETSGFIFGKKVMKKCNIKDNFDINITQRDKFFME